MKRIAFAFSAFLVLCLAISCNNKSTTPGATTTPAGVPAVLTDAQLKDTIQKSFKSQLEVLFSGRAQIQEVTVDSVTMVTEHGRMEAVAKQFAEAAMRYDTINKKQIPKQYWHQVDSLKTMSHHVADSLKNSLSTIDDTDKKYYKIHFNLKVMTQQGPQAASETTFLDKNYKIMKL